MQVHLPLTFQMWQIKFLSDRQKKILTCHSERQAVKKVNFRPCQYHATWGGGGLFDHYSQNYLHHFLHVYASITPLFPVRNDCTKVYVIIHICTIYCTFSLCTIHRNSNSQMRAFLKMAEHNSLRE